MWFDPYFGAAFALEILMIIPLYIKAISKHHYKYHNGLKGIIICSIAAIIWLITELNCQLIFITGHSIWHLGMGLGLNYLIKFLRLIIVPVKINHKFQGCEY